MGRVTSANVRLLWAVIGQLPLEAQSWRVDVDDAVRQAGRVRNMVVELVDDDGILARRRLSEVDAVILVDLSSSGTRMTHVAGDLPTLLLRRGDVAKTLSSKDGVVTASFDSAESLRSLVAQFVYDHSESLTRRARMRVVPGPWATRLWESSQLEWAVLSPSERHARAVSTTIAPDRLEQLLSDLPSFCCASLDEVEAVVTVLVPAILAELMGRGARRGCRLPRRPRSTSRATSTDGRLSTCTPWRSRPFGNETSRPSGAGGLRRSPRGSSSTTGTTVRDVAGSIAAWMLERHGIAPAPPVNVEQLARGMGVSEIVELDVPEDGRLETGRGGARIVVKRGAAAARRRFTLAHELAHLALLSDREDVIRLRVRGYVTNEERFCDAIATALY